MPRVNVTKARKKSRIIKKGSKKWKQNKLKLNVGLTVGDNFPETDNTKEDESDGEGGKEDTNLSNEEGIGGSFGKDQETQVDHIFLDFIAIL